MFLRQKYQQQQQATVTIGHLGQHNTDRIISILCCAAQGGRGTILRALLH